ncbi:MAG: transcriptional repressor [Candidatus Limiplasma sp.]|nr:transcriptional repressor [Candidatus Limiplasma sp.]
MANKPAPTHLDPLKQSGLKNTRQRKAILDILASGNQPFAAEDVYLSLKQNQVDINLSTVYRSLETMREKNVVRKVSVAGDNRMLYELNLHTHQHYLVCVQCKKICPVGHCPLESFEKSVAQETNYTIMGHRLDIYGLCPDCQQTRQPDR